MNPDYAALSASDGAGEPVRATVQSPGRSIGSTTIPVQATTNWPAGTFIATTGTLLSSGKLDPTTVQVFYGTASGTDITITAFAAGYTDKGNEAGDVVVIKPTTEWANVVAEGILGTTQFPANFANFVEPSTGIWSAGSGLVGSGTSGFVWYNGARAAMAAVTNHTFTASKDTYIDYNPTSATWTYLPETNGATEPAVSTGSVRVAKVVTGASAISSVSQNFYNAPVLPTTLGGNKVWQYLGDNSSTSGFSTQGTSNESTGLGVPLTLPANLTKVRIRVHVPQATMSSLNTLGFIFIYQGASIPVNNAAVVGTQLNETAINIAQASDGSGIECTAFVKAPSAGPTNFYLAYVSNTGSITLALIANANAPITIEVDGC